MRSRIEFSNAVFPMDVKFRQLLKAYSPIEIQLLKSILLRFVHPLNVLLFILIICFESFTSSSFEQPSNTEPSKELQLLMSIDFNEEQYWKALPIIVVQLERSSTDCKLLQFENALLSIVLHFFRLTDCKFLQFSKALLPIVSQLLISMLLRELQLLNVE